MTFGNLLTIARKLDNYEIYTGVADVYWVDTTNFKATVPTGKRWFLFGGHCDRENASTLNVFLKDPSDNIIMMLSYYSSGTGSAVFPIETYAGIHIFPIVMDAGDYVHFVFGSAQSTAAYASCHVLEIDI